MSKVILLAGTALVFISAAAVAADLPSRRAPPVFVPPKPAFTWTGVYLGGNVGYAFSNSANETTVANDPITQSQLTIGVVPVSHGQHRNGVTAGGQIGYNYEFSGTGVDQGIVVGVEADAAYTDLGASDTVLGTFNTPNVYHEGLDYLGTVRGRVGYAFDRFLVYGTGGFAYGESGYSHGIYPNNGATSPVWSGSGSGMQTGYAVGGGIEYALAPSVFNAGAVTIRAEFLHYDLGSGSAVLLPGPIFGPPGTSFTDNYRASGNLVRAALNYKLDFGASAPVVARY